MAWALRPWVQALALALVLALAACPSCALEPGAQENEDFADIDEFEDFDELEGDGSSSSSYSAKAQVPVAGGAGVGDANGAGFTIAVSHCPSAPRARAFDEFKARLERIYPGASVTGVPDEPSVNQRMAGVALTVLRYTLFAYCWSGRRIHASLGLAVPSWYTVIEKSPLTPIMVVYYVTNIAQERVMSTGVFDATVNGKRVWVSADEGRWPSWQELLWKLEEAGLPRVDGADAEANWPSGWQEAKAADPEVHGEA